MAERSALRRVIRATKAPMPNVERAFCSTAEAVADEYGITTADLLGKSRKPTHAIPRQHLCWLMVNKFKFSTPEVGDLLGRDHTTVLYACKRHEGRMNGSP